jgi:hypothetical protein
LATSPISLSWRAKVAEGRLNYFGIFTLQMNYNRKADNQGGAKQSRKNDAGSPKSNCSLQIYPK